MSIEEYKGMKSNIDLSRVYAEVEAILRVAEERSTWRYSRAIHDDADLWIEQNRRPTFQQALMEWISKKGMTPPEFYGAAWIDRKLFSAIKTNVRYSPRKETAVACCLALQLSIQETEELLDKAGYQLSMSKEWDLIVRYCIVHGIYEIGAVNDLLNHYGENAIGV